MYIYKNRRGLLIILICVCFIKRDQSGKKGFSNGLELFKLLRKPLSPQIATDKKQLFHSLLTLVVDESSKLERNKLSDHFNCILVVRIDTCSFTQKYEQNPFWSPNREDRSLRHDLLNVQLIPWKCNCESHTFLLPHMNSQPESCWPILSSKAVTKRSPLSDGFKLSTTTVSDS